MLLALHPIQVIHYLLKKIKQWFKFEVTDIGHRAQQDNLIAVQCKWFSGKNVAASFCQIQRLAWSSQNNRINWVGTNLWPLEIHMQFKHSDEVSFVILFQNYFIFAIKSAYIFSLNMSYLQEKEKDLQWEKGCLLQVLCQPGKTDERWLNAVHRISGAMLSRYAKYC